MHGIEYIACKQKPQEAIVIHIFPGLLSLCCGGVYVSKALAIKPYQEKLQHEQEISLCVVSHRRVVVVCNYSKAYSLLKHCE